MSYLIDLKNIVKTYRMGDNELTVLKNIDFHVAAGELMSIMGASGSGKSTMMNIIGLLDRPTTGSYHLNGEEVSTLNDNQLAEIRNQMVGFVFQSFFLLPRLTALQNVGLPLLYRGVSHHEIKEHAMDMLKNVGMADKVDHRPYELSGGQQQRVAIARALIGKPRLILADEPTGALDTKIGQDVMDLFINLHKEANTTLVIITHDPHIAEQCERTVHISDGKIVDEETR